MSFMTIINKVSHRPWPLPSRKWLMRQSWRNLLFIHWPLSTETLRQYVPSSLQIDTFDGQAWLSIVVLEMEGIYLRGMPFRLLLPTFPVINLRTYVLHRNQPGVYFLSLDTEDWISYTCVKRWYHLPYYAAEISFQKKGQTFHFDSVRKRKIETPITCRGTYRPFPEISFPEKGTLEHWLTERYCLFSLNKRNNLYCGDIHHRPWPVQKVKAVLHKNTLLSPFHIDLSEIRPIVHFSKGIDSLIWNIKKV